MVCDEVINVEEQWLWWQAVGRDQYWHAKAEYHTFHYTPNRTLVCKQPDQMYYIIKSYFD